MDLHACKSEHRNLSVWVHLTLWFQISLACVLFGALWSPMCTCALMHVCVFVCMPERVYVCLRGMKLTLILSSLRQIRCSACRHCHGNKPVSLGTREKAKFKL